MRSYRLSALVCLALAAPPALGQGTRTSGGGLSDSDSSASYIDSALPRNMLRLHFDDASRNRQPTRAEYFYAKAGLPFSPGPPLPERNIDFQEASLYAEWAPIARLSGFVEMGLRALDPDFNRNDIGPGDLCVGAKWAFLDAEGLLASFQLRTYVPTGSVSRGLGTGHVSLEPALLINYRPLDALVVEGEVRYWVPVGGTDFAGDVIRYGIGLSGATSAFPGPFWATPVVEFVGWTVLSGKSLEVQSPTDFAIKGAAGDTIVNAKVGMRVGLRDLGDVYVGYGRALTGEVWYRDIWRAEVRFFY